MKLRFDDGIEIDTTGPLRKLYLDDGWYVVGEGTLCPVDNEEERTYEKKLRIQEIKVKEHHRVVLNNPVKTRVYFFVADESILENLTKRFHRPYEAYRKILPEVFKQINLPPDIKAKWRQKAGCKCGCSPGFILDGDNVKHIFVTITEEEER